MAEQGERRGGGGDQRSGSIEGTRSLAGSRRDEEAIAPVAKAGGDDAGFEKLVATEPDRLPTPIVGVGEGWNHSQTRSAIDCQARAASIQI
jgi:hypothetical protein